MTKYERAVQIWPLLTSAAGERKSYTYEGLGKVIGVPKHGLFPLLAPIYHYCKDKALPKLTILVVSVKTGMPISEGMPKVNIDNVNKLREEVFQHAWHEKDSPRPQISDFEEIIKNIKQR